MKKIKLKKILSTILMFSMIFTISACGNKAETQPAGDAAKNQTQQSQASSSKGDSDAMAKIKKAKKLVLGTNAGYPPYEFHKSINGKDTIVGFDIEIGKEIAKDLGVELEIKDMDFNGLIAALTTGNIDIIAAGMTPTDERKQSVDFSKVYYTAVQTLVVKAGDKDKLKSIDDLKSKKVGVQKGSIQEDIAKEQMPNSTANPLAKIPDLIASLEANRIDAVILESPVSKAYTSKDKNIVVSDVKLKSDEAGSAIATRKNSPDLVESINKTLDRLMKDNGIDKLVLQASEQVE